MDATSPASLYTAITLPVLPLQLAILILVISLPAAAVAGYLAGSKRRRLLLAAGGKIDMAVGGTTLGAILALLGLLLAFSFGNALVLSQARKSAIVAEAAALGTVFQRADYLAEPGRTKLQSSILDYARTRLVPGDGRINSFDKAHAFLDRTLDAQAKLWPLTLEATAPPTPVPVSTFVADAMNDALDAHLYRVATLSNPVSHVTEGMMLAAALLSLFLLGNRAGMVGRTVKWSSFVFAGFLLVVMSTIVDTQRGGEGLVRADDTALRVTIFDMELALADRV